MIIIGEIIIFTVYNEYFLIMIFIKNIFNKYYFLMKNFLI